MTALLLLNLLISSHDIATEAAKMPLAPVQLAPSPNPDPHRRTRWIALAAGSMTEASTRAWANKRVTKAFPLEASLGLGVAWLLDHLKPETANHLAGSVVVEDALVSVVHVVNGIDRSPHK